MWKFVDYISFGENLFKNFKKTQWHSLKYKEKQNSSQNVKNYENFYSENTKWRLMQNIYFVNGKKYNGVRTGTKSSLPNLLEIKTFLLCHRHFDELSWNVKGNNW